MPHGTDLPPAWELWAPSWTAGRAKRRMIPLGDAGRRSRIVPRRSMAPSRARSWSTSVSPATRSPGWSPPAGCTACSPASTRSVAAHSASAAAGWRAVLACGPGALLSHRSGAALRSIRRGSQTLIEVTVPSDRARAIAGVRVYRCGRMARQEKGRRRHPVHLGRADPARTGRRHRSPPDRACLRRGRGPGRVRPAGGRGSARPRRRPARRRHTAGGAARAPDRHDPDPKRAGGAGARHVPTSGAAAAEGQRAGPLRAGRVAHRRLLLAGAPGDPRGRRPSLPPHPVPSSATVGARPTSSSPATACCGRRDCRCSASRAAWPRWSARRSAQRSAARWMKDRAGRPTNPLV